MGVRTTSERVARAYDSHLGTLLTLSCVPSFNAPAALILILLISSSKGAFLLEF